MLGEAGSVSDQWPAADLPLASSAERRLTGRVAKSPASMVAVYRQTQAEQRRAQLYRWGHAKIDANDPYMGLFCRRPPE